MYIFQNSILNKGTFWRELFRKTKEHPSYPFLVDRCSGKFDIFLLSVDHVAHVIASGRLSCQIFGGFQSAFSKYCLGICRMLELDHFIRIYEDHFMFPYDGSAPDCGNSNLAVDYFSRFWLRSNTYSYLPPIASFRLSARARAVPLGASTFRR